MTVKIAKRAEGRSAVAMAAYRSGQRLRDDYSGRVADFRRRKGVIHCEILAPDGTPEKFFDRELLWNEAQKAEKRRDAQLCREIEIATPVELSHEERLTLVRDYVRSEFVSQGMIADVAWHGPGKEDDRNFHSHVMLTMRQVDNAKGEFFRSKTRAWNSDQQLATWRKSWAEHQNRALERAGVNARVDHRTLEVQRAEARKRGDHAAAVALDRQPEIHMGPEAVQTAERRVRDVPSRKVIKATARPQEGLWRSAKRPEKRQRVVDYTRFDKGDRREANRNVTARNADRLGRKITRLQVMGARLRERRHRFDQQVSGARETPGKRGEPLRLTPHRLKRRNLIELLIRDLDRTLAALFGVRKNALLRVRALERTRVPARGRGRERERGFGLD